MCEILNCKGNEIYSILNRIITECLGKQGRNTETINPNTSLLNLGINSIVFIKIIVSIETEFEFEFGDEDLDVNKFPTIQSLVTYVESRINYN